MPIFTSPKCQRSYNAPNQSAGQKFDCDCGHRVQIPATVATSKTVMGVVVDEAVPMPILGVRITEPPDLVLTDRDALPEPRRRKKKRELEESSDEGSSLGGVLKVAVVVFLIGALAMLCGALIVKHLNTAQQAPAPQAIPVAPVNDDSLVRHPWWHSRPTQGRVDQIVVTLMHLQRMNELGDFCSYILHSNGETTKFPDDGPARRNDFIIPGFERVHGGLVGGTDNISIMFSSGPRGARPLKSVEAKVLLRQMLDSARASEEKWRKTGIGDGQLDDFMNMKIPDSGPQPMPNLKD